MVSYKRNGRIEGEDRSILADSSLPLSSQFVLEAAGGTRDLLLQLKKCIKVFYSDSYSYFY